MTKTDTKKYLILLLLLIVFASPFFLAKWVFYQHGSAVLSTLGTVNQGKLIQPMVTLNVSTSDLAHKWYLCYIAENNTHDIAIILDKMQRIRLSLGKEFSQVGLLIGETQAIDVTSDVPTDALKILIPQHLVDQLLAIQGKPSGIFIMDPAHHIILAYPVDVNSEAIYQDIQRLLKVQGATK